MHFPFKDRKSAMILIILQSSVNTLKGFLHKQKTTKSVGECLHMERRDVKKKKKIHKIKIFLGQKMFPVCDLRCVTILQIIFSQNIFYLTFSPVIFCKRKKSDSTHKN